MIKNGGSPGRQCEAPGRARVQLVNITPITMVCGTHITIVTGAYINQLITGGGLTLYQFYMEYDP